MRFNAGPTPIWCIFNFTLFVSNIAATEPEEMAPNASYGTALLHSKPESWRTIVEEAEIGLALVEVLQLFVAEDWSGTFGL